MLKLSTKHLKGSMPKAAARALIKTLRRTKRMQKKHMARYISATDADDSAAEVLAACIEYIQNHTELDWDEDTWVYKLRNVARWALVEYVKNIIFPLPLPRLVRFSLKKYTDVQKILHKYNENLETVIFNYRCPLAECLHKCLIGYAQCPLLNLSVTDHRRIYELTRGETKSLKTYAEMANKDIAEWIQLMKEVSMFSIQTITPDMAMVIQYDLESELDLSTIRRKFLAVHPKLYELYCELLEDQNSADTITDLPNGWVGKDLKDRFGLSAEEIKGLLHQANSIINQLKAANGLPHLQGGLYTKSAEQ